MTRRRRSFLQTLHSAGTCPACYGTGRSALQSPTVVRGIACPACGGTGSSR